MSTSSNASAQPYQQIASPSRASSADPVANNQSQGGPEDDAPVGRDAPELASDREGNLEAPLSSRNGVEKKTFDFWKSVKTYKTTI